MRVCVGSLLLGAESSSARRHTAVRGFPADRPPSGWRSGRRGGRRGRPEGRYGAVVRRAGTARSSGGPVRRRGFSRRKGIIISGKHGPRPRIIRGFFASGGGGPARRINGAGPGLWAGPRGLLRAGRSVPAFGFSFCRRTALYRSGRIQRRALMAFEASS